MKSKLFSAQLWAAALRDAVLYAADYSTGCSFQEDPDNFHRADGSKSNYRHYDFQTSIPVILTTHGSERDSYEV